MGANQPINNDIHNQNVKPNGSELSINSVKTYGVSLPAAIICANNIPATTTPEPLSIICCDKLLSVAVIPIIITNGTNKLMCPMSLIPKNNGKITANPHDNRYNIERLRRRDATIELAINKMKERVRKISRLLLE